MLSHRGDTIREQVRRTLSEVQGALERAETDEDLSDVLEVLRGLEGPVRDLVRRLRPLAGLEGSLDATMARLQKIRRT